jgi:hypothetical protein
LDRRSQIRNPQSPINPQSAILNPQFCRVRLIGLAVLAESGGPKTAPPLELLRRAPVLLVRRIAPGRSGTKGVIHRRRRPVRPARPSRGDVVFTRSRRPASTARTTSPTTRTLDRQRCG